MAPPARIVNWLKTTFVRPRINLEWLDACCEYLTGEMGVDPNDFEALRSHVEEQFLQSSLSDSVVRNTGFPAPDSHDVRIKNTLCEVLVITEIGHSAFSLKNVRQARVDKEDLAGLAGDMDDGEDYSIPKYPRSMLRFELSDGFKTMRAIEYRRIPDLELGVTPLGTKVRIALKTFVQVFSHMFW
jgi:RecQ-mediated genome instability protein 1